MSGRELTTNGDHVTFEQGYTDTQASIEFRGFQPTLDRYNGGQCHRKSEFEPWSSYWKGSLLALREAGKLKES